MLAKIAENYYFPVRTDFFETVAKEINHFSLATAREY